MGETRTDSGSSEEEIKIKYHNTFNHGYKKKKKWKKNYTSSNRLTTQVAIEGSEHLKDKDMKIISDCVIKLLENHKHGDRFSVKVFAESVHTIFGLKPTQYINEKRLKKEILEMNKTLKEKIGTESYLFDAIGEIIDTFPRNAKYKESHKEFFIFTTGKNQIGKKYSLEDLKEKIDQESTIFISIFLELD